MKINEVTEATVDRRPGYAKQDNPTTTKYAAIGNLLQDHTKTMNMKDDDQIKLSNVIGQVGEELTLINTGGGARSLDEIAKRCGTSTKMVKQIIEFGQKLYKEKGDTRQGDPEAGGDYDDIDSDTKEFDGPDDDEVARQADMVARGR